MLPGNLSKEDFVNAADAIGQYVKTLQERRDTLAQTGPLIPSIQVWFDEHTKYLLGLAQALSAYDPGRQVNKQAKKYNELLERYNKLEKLVSDLDVQTIALRERATALEQQVNATKGATDDNE